MENYRLIEINTDTGEVEKAPFKKGDRVRLSKKWQHYCHKQTGWRVTRHGTIHTGVMNKDDCFGIKWDGLISLQYYHHSFLEKAEEISVEPNDSNIWLQAKRFLEHGDLTVKEYTDFVSAPESLVNTIMKVLTAPVGNRE